MADGSVQKLKALPVQFIETSQGVILKRGCVEIRISGEGTAEAVRKLLMATGYGGVTRQEIYSLFTSSSKPVINELIEELINRRLLVVCDRPDSMYEGSSNNLEVFYWHFGQTAARVTENLNTRKVVILGVNSISRQLIASFVSSGVKNFELIDHPCLRNLRFFHDSGALKIEQFFDAPTHEYSKWFKGFGSDEIDCVVVTSDFGAHTVIREWNKICVERRKHFFPVILQNVIGYIGPLIIPGETACLECLRGRQNSHAADQQLQQVMEESSFESQHIMGYHPSMACVLGDIAAFELTKFYSSVLPMTKVGTLLELNLLVSRLTARKVLKLPRCLVCSPLNGRSSTALNIPDNGKSAEQ